MSKATYINRQIDGFGAHTAFRRFDSAGAWADAAQACDNRYTRASGSSWNGHTGFDDCVRLTRNGDLSTVAASDKLLTRFESAAQFDTKAHATVSAVAGGVPNVPAMLAGHPLAMRQRRRVEAPQAPLTILADIGASAGVDADEMRKRGVAILALVRALAHVRPVTLYACAAMLPRGSVNPDTGGALSTCAWAFPIDTAPLDLARAAHILTNPSILRTAGFALVCQMGGNRGMGSIAWANDNSAAYKRHMVTAWADVLNLDPADVLAIPAAHVNDDNVKKPAVWLEQQLEKYGRAAE